jgi:hypothetical protein
MCFWKYHSRCTGRFLKVKMSRKVLEEMKIHTPISGELCGPYGKMLSILILRNLRPRTRKAVICQDRFYFVQNIVP